MFFTLNNSLQLQYKSLLDKIDKEFIISGLYVLEDDYLMVVGRNYSIILSLEDGSVARQDDFDHSVIPQTPDMIVEGTLRNEMLKYVLMCIRKKLDIRPVADEYMMEVLRSKLNGSLKFFDTEIMSDSRDRVVDIYYKGNAACLENIMEIIADESCIEGIIGGFDEDLLHRLVGLGRFKDALTIYKELSLRTDDDSMFGTEVNMKIGELYYHIDRLDKSVEYYLKCNPVYIKNLRDYHIRIGHSLLDDSAGLKGSLIKMYYRCALNGSYKKSISDKYDRLVEQVAGIYKDHEAKCEAAGKAKADSIS